MSRQKGYDATVARIAGNLLSGMATSGESNEKLAAWAVDLARAIVAETKRTEPQESPKDEELTVADLLELLPAKGKPGRG